MLISLFYCFSIILWLFKYKLDEIFSKFDIIFIHFYNCRHVKLDLKKTDFLCKSEFVQKRFPFGANSNRKV